MVVVGEDGSWQLVRPLAKVSLTVQGWPGEVEDAIGSAIVEAFNNGSDELAVKVFIEDQGFPFLDGGPAYDQPVLNFKVVNRGGVE